MKIFVITYFTYINIQQSVTIYICNRHTGFPVALALYTGPGCDIFKFKIPFIDIKFIAFKIGRKINISKPIVIKISKGYTSTVVIVEIVKNIKRVGISYTVYKIDPGFSRGQRRKQCILFLCAAIQQTESKQPIS